jgi:uncharacterized protein
MSDFARNLADRISRADRGESPAEAHAASASGLALGLRAALMALRRVYRRFFVPYDKTYAS